MVNPLYSIGECQKCGERIFVPEDKFAAHMNCLREIADKEYSYYVFGAHISVPIFSGSKDCGGQQTFHSLRMTAKIRAGEENNKIYYSRD